MGLAAPQRKSAEHGYAPLSKENRFRETVAIPVAFEEPGNAHPPGMIATEPGVDSIHLLETVGEPRGRQFVRRQPPAKISERSCDHRKSGADQGESCQHAGCA